MRIGIVVKEFPPDIMGGTEVQTMRMAEKLSEKHEVIVFTKKYKKHNADKRNYEVIRVPNIRFNSILSTFTFILLAPFFIMKYRKNIEVLQCMMIYPCGFIGLMVNKFFNISFFSWIQGGDWYFAKENIFKRFLIKRVIKDSLVVAQSEKVKNEVLNEFPTAKMTVIPNGIEIPNENANGDKIIFVGNLIERKGVEYLLEATRDLSNEVVIVGDGPEREKLERIATNNVKFVGKVSPNEVSSFLKSGEVFVLPSIKGEGLPNVIQEAMSYGLPIVATNLAGIPDLVKNGYNGFIVEPMDSKKLELAIKKIIEDEDLHKWMSENSLKEMNKYSWENVIKKLESVYRQLTQKMDEV